MIRGRSSAGESDDESAGRVDGRRLGVGVDGDVEQCGVDRESDHRGIRGAIAH